MHVLKNNYLHRIFAFILALIVLFPFTVQAMHALENHEHEICNAKDVKHIHQQDVDCSVYHLQVQQNSFDFSSTFDLYNPKNLVTTFDTYQQANYTLYTSLKSSRAPPYFIG